MHIKTERGWRPLQTPPMASIPELPPRYRGPLPSLELLSYVASLDKAHAEWLERRAELESHK